MSKFVVALIVVVVGILGTVGVAVIYGLGVFNQGNVLEKALIAEQTNNRNLLSTYGKKVVEAAQVTGMQRDDLTKVVTATMQGRYGANGSGATMQWFKEQNMQLDSKVYIKVQQIIESGRNEFQQGQTQDDQCKAGLYHGA